MIIRQTLKSYIMKFLRCWLIKIRKLIVDDCFIAIIQTQDATYISAWKLQLRSCNEMTIQINLQMSIHG